MPPKKRKFIGQIAPSSRKIQSIRLAETSEENESRLEQNRLRNEHSRLTESAEMHEARLEENRVRINELRAAESNEEHEARLQALRVRNAATRATETTVQHDTRTQNDRLRHVQSRRMSALSNLKLAAFNYDKNYDYQHHPKVAIGKMDIICENCHAMRFNAESRGICCSNGKIKLPELNVPPEPLNTYMSGTTSESKHFLQNIRRYNSCFQMTSFGTTARVTETGFMPTFKVQGQIYHQAGAILPLPNEDPKFLQIYFVGDEDIQANQRCGNVPGVKENIILDLQRFLHENNNLVNIFKVALDKMPTDDYKIVIRADKRPAGEHERRFNSPTINEVAVVIVDNQFDKRDIVLQRRSENLQRISETHRSYDALQYPIIFWQGEDGYHFNIMQINPSTALRTNKKVSAMDFYAYRIMIRTETENHILKCRQLFHQFIVDMYAKIESERLLFIRLNQRKLRVDDYIHLRDAVATDGNVADIGQMVILPSTFTGSPRHMHEYAQDAMSYVRMYGRPDLFITVTCNPAWSEIKNELCFGQAPTDRHDIIARVFKQKLIKLIDVITKCHIYGETNCWMYSIEWQKRGLPHSHILIWLKEKIHASHIDDIISAEFPNPEEDHILFDIISKNMIHGPCGLLNPNAPCMKEGHCTKKYPREMRCETYTGDDGYPLYRRRKPEEGGYSAIVKMKLNNQYREIEVDNKWVVPYTPLLSKMFQAHINVEYCNSVKSIKYICKYINKGSDMAVFGFASENRVDEITQYQLGRYISSNEAVWRILNFSIHDRYPTVVHLSIHLENGQRVFFTVDNAQERAAQPPKTTLTAFFSLCQQDLFAKTLLYPEVPKYYTWNATRKEFCRRKQGNPVPGYNVRASDALGRVYTVHPNNAECYYLRLLLHTVRGPTSFNDLKTVNGEVCESYREACQRHGLLENDQQWDTTLSEASLTCFPAQLRNLFAIILTTCSPSDPKYLWNKYKDAFSEDILRAFRIAYPTMHLHFSSDIYNQALILLEDKCRSMNGKSLLELGLQSPPRDVHVVDRDILREKSYNIQNLEAFVKCNKPLLTNDQRLAYNSILQQISSGSGGLFFLDAPGGTGKTFLINLMLAEIRKNNEIALAVASSGIAATLLHGGRTAHSALKLPLNVGKCETPICNIRKGSGQAEVLKTCKVIIWDECTMSHKKALEALYRTLQDVRGNTQIMGGTVVILAGDFRQTLPVIPRSTPADELNACLKASFLWRYAQKRTLTTNMRVHLLGDINAQNFADQLLCLGEGKFPMDPLTGLIQFPSNFCTLVTSVYELISKVFPDILENFNNHEWLCERAILAPKNECVNAVNNKTQDQLPGPVTIYKSIDTVIDNDQAVFYPTEFLNSLEPTGMPPHNLILKVGSPIMLMRNLEPPKLCNGTRLCVKTLLPNVIEATVLTGCVKGEDVFIPRIPLIPTDMPFSFKRLQFPVRLAFCISINKAQGQSLKTVGINLESPCFSHGQLYVACSRVGTPENLYILAPDGKTKNIVYRKVLE